MLFTSRYWALALSIATLTNALPLDGALKPGNLAPRAKSYSIVNVDGGFTAPADATSTAVVTLKVTSSTSTPTSTPSSAPANKQPHASPKPTPSPKPSVVTVIVTETVSPTEFYDDGMWKTRYPVKTFEQAIVTTTSSSTSSTPTATTTSAQAFQ